MLEKFEIFGGGRFDPGWIKKGDGIFFKRIVYLESAYPI